MVISFIRAGMIGTLLFILFERGLSIIRWNNFSRVEDVSALDNLGYSLHTALLLAHYERVRTGYVFDEKYIMLQLILSTFPKLVLSDINSSTRDYLLMHSDHHLFYVLWDTMQDRICGLPAEYDFIRDDMTDFFEISTKERT